MGPNGLVFVLVVGACRAVGWEKLGRRYGDLLVTYLVHKGESQVASPVFQCGPPKVVPQQISDAGVVTGVSLWRFICVINVTFMPRQKYFCRGIINNA